MRKQLKWLKAGALTGVIGLAVCCTTLTAEARHGCGRGYHHYYGGYSGYCTPNRGRYYMRHHRWGWGRGCCYVWRHGYRFYRCPCVGY